MIFPQYLRSLDSLINEEEGGSALHKNTKNNEVIFSLAWNIIFTDKLKSSCFEVFGDEKYGISEPTS